jgi:hypothetical protein
MKEQKKAKIIAYVILVIIIIAGIIVFKIRGLNRELDYSDRQEITISTSNELDISKIKEIAKDVLGEKTVEVRKVERFGNSVEIISTTITDEEKENIVSKINEEYSEEIENDDITVVSISKNRIKDIVKPYVLPIAITFVVVLIYFIIIYHKIGLKEVILKSIFIPIIAELEFYALMIIGGAPFGKIVIACTLGIYVASIVAITIYFQKKKNKLIEENKKEEND